MNHQKYRWFYTSTGKLVIGGKNSEQNEELVKEMMKSSNKLVFHTSAPGSPFSFILSEIKNLNKKDILETAIFTACFSHEWKKQKKKSKIDLFESRNIFKSRLMKEGTFSVKKSTSKEVPLFLYLTEQDKKPRAVPFPVGNIKLIPGMIEKEKASELLSKLTGYSKEELMQALPAGGFKIIVKK